MKKRTTFFAITALLMALILASSCSQSPQTADLKVTLDENSRTLSPKTTDFEVAKYHIECLSKSGGDPIEIDTVRTSVVIQGLPVGTYTISATGSNQAGIEIVRGSTEFNLTSTNTTAQVVLKELIGNGGLDITFTWDENLITKPRVDVRLEPVDNQNTQTVTETLEISGASASFTQSGLPSGSYRLSASLYSGTTRIAGCVEAVRIGSDSTVEATISFNLDELPSSAGQLTLQNQAGVPVVCTINGISDGATVQAQSELTASLTTEGLEDSMLTVDWFLDGTEIGSGKSVSFSPDPGEHRLDVVASTAKLGSLGSAAITFEAALLGQTGVPVLGSMLENGSVSGLSLSAGTLTDFLPDGALLIVDNSTKKAQVAQIKRNTLELVSSQTLAHPVEALTAMDGSSRVIMVHSDTMEAMAYSYNSGTGKLSEQLGNGSYADAEKALKYTKIFGISKNSHIDDAYTITGTVMIENNPDDVMDVSTFHSATDSGALYNGYVGIDMTSTAGQDKIFSTLESGSDAVIINPETGLTVFEVILEGERTRVFYEKLSYTDPTAAISLPAGNVSTMRFVVADGDRLRFFEGDKNGALAAAFTETGSPMTRQEGSGLNTVAFLLSADEAFLYALNAGNGTVSTYSIGAGGTLTYVGSTDLGFTPKSATISPNGEYMIVTGTGGQLAIMRIKTS